MPTTTNVTINGVQYRPVNTAGDRKIVILQRGWVMVGTYTKDGDQCRLDDASIIRMWGTTKGLGEIALNGPTSTTVLDPVGTVMFNEMTAVAVLDCVESKWSR